MTFLVLVSSVLRLNFLPVIAKYTKKIESCRPKEGKKTKNKFLIFVLSVIKRRLSSNRCNFFSVALPKLGQ